MWKQKHCLKMASPLKKKYEDAKMLKNLYNTFISELEYINKGKNQEMIDERTFIQSASIHIYRVGF